MIKVMLYDAQTGSARRGGQELLSQWPSDGDGWIWADFEAEDLAAEAALFERKFGLDPLVIADAQNPRHPPKLESFDDYFFMLLNGLDAATENIQFSTIQVAMFVGRGFLVTRRKDRSLSIDSTWAEVEAGTLKLERGPVHAAYRIVRRLTDRYTGIVSGVDRKLDELENEMFGNPRDELLEQLLGFAENLKKLRRIFTYHQTLFARLSRQGNTLIGKRGRHEFTDVFEHTEHLASLSTLYKELTDDLINGYLSLSSHRLNRIMQVLTIVTVIFSPLTLLVGIYGMNFEDMPELKVQGAYFVFLGVMALIAITLLLLFKKIRWL